MTTETKNQPPLQTFKDGAVSIKLWQQDVQDRTYVNASVGRIFKDKETGEFRETRTFSDTDLLKIQAMIPEVRQEIKKWQEYYREAGREQQTAPPQAPEIAPEQNMLVQRDAALSAAPNQQDMQHSQEHTRTPGKEPAR